MPPKQNGGECVLTSKQFTSSMTKLLSRSNTNLEITNGAMEALRVAHSQFLNLLASELACNEEKIQGVIQPNVVKKSLDKLGFQHLNILVEKEAQSGTISKKTSKTRKRKRFQITQDLIQQQEELLNQSRRRLVQDKETKDQPKA